MLGRSLFSINLPKDILTALTRNGYQTIQDVTATNPEILAKGMLIGYSLSDAHLDLRPQYRLARSSCSP